MQKARRTPCRATQAPQKAINFELLNLEADVVKTAEWVVSAWRNDASYNIRLSMLLQELDRTVRLVEAARKAGA
jgi:hypothetical protein